MYDHINLPWHARVASRSGVLERPPFIDAPSIAPLLRRRRRREAIAQFESLTDHLLDDIGISRGDIPRVVDALISGDARHTSPRTRPATVEENRYQLRRAA